LTSPASNQPGSATAKVQVDRLLQPGAQPVADRGPALAIVVVADEAIPRGRRVQPSSTSPCSSTGRVVTREEILDTLWGMDYVSESNIVDRQIGNLQARLKDDWRQLRFIPTVPGRRPGAAAAWMRHATPCSTKVAVRW
jgi:hypothetical protein